MTGTRDVSLTQDPKAGYYYPSALTKKSSSVGTFWSPEKLHWYFFFKVKCSNLIHFRMQLSDKIFSNVDLEVSLELSVFAHTLKSHGKR